MRNDAREDLGLRERKKRATRRALGWAAVRLAAERGLERVRVEEIAAAADVSPRTFNNYFASKEAAIVSLAVEPAALVAPALRRRPVDESMADALCSAFVDGYAPVARQDRRALQGLRLTASAPSLVGEYLKALVACERALAVAISERRGRPVEDMRSEVLATAAFAAARIALRRWVMSGEESRLTDLLHQAVGEVVAPGGVAGQVTGVGGVGDDARARASDGRGG